MLLTFYLIVSSILVQKIYSAEWKTNNSELQQSSLRGNSYKYAFLQSKRSVSESVSNKNDISNTEVSMLPSLYSTTKEHIPKYQTNNNKVKINRDLKNILGPSLDELKGLLSNLIEKVNKLQEGKRDTSAANTKQKNAKELRNTMIKHIGNMKIKPLWGEWTDWSGCSVTCGKGRMIKWRHCLENCYDMETEMEEKTCQLPACSSKLFGLINL